MFGFSPSRHAYVAFAAGFLSLVPHAAGAADTSLLPVFSQHIAPQRQIFDDGAKWRIFPLNQSAPAFGITISNGLTWFTPGTCCNRAPAFESISQKGAITPYYLPGLFPYQIASGGGWLFMESANFIQNILAYSPATQELIIYGGTGPSGDTVGQGQLAWAPTGDLWYLESTHYARLTHRGKVYEYLSPAPPSGAMILGADGQMWISLRSKQLLRVDPATRKVETLTLPSPDECTPSSAVFSMANAADGSLWVACFSVVNLLDVTYLYRVGDGQPKIQSFGPFALRAYGMAGAPDGRIFIANGYPNTLAYFDPKQGALGFYYSSNHDGVGALAIGRRGHVWGIMGPTPAIAEFTP